MLAAVSGEAVSPIARRPGTRRPLRRGDRRGRSGGLRGRPRAELATARAASSSRRGPTSAPGRARRTRRFSTPASTPSPGRSSRASSPAATSCSASTPSEVGIPIARLGALMVAWTPEQREALAGIEGDRGARTVTRRRARSISRSSTRGSPTSVRGPRVRSRSRARGSSARSRPRSPSRRRRSAPAASSSSTPRSPACGRVGGGHEIDTARGRIRAEYLVNAAGLRSDEIDAMLGHSDFRVTPRRGELIVFDKLARGLVNHILLPVPTEKTKGVLVSPTDLRERPARPDGRRHRGQDGPLDDRRGPRGADGGRRAHHSAPGPTRR